MLGSQLQPSALDVLHPGRVAVLFEGGAGAVKAQLDDARTLVGGVAADETVWAESRARQAAAKGRCGFTPGELRTLLDSTSEAIVRPAPGVAYVPEPVAAERSATERAVVSSIKHLLDPAGPAVIGELTKDCVHCGFCLPTCPTYVLDQEEMDSPRGRIQLMDAKLGGLLPLDDTMAMHFDRCLGCLACVSSCPSGVRYDALIEETRHVVESEHRRPFGERLQRSLLFATLPYRRRMRLALALAPIARRLPAPRFARAMLEVAPGWKATAQAPASLTAVGASRGRVGLLTGCVQSAMFGEVNAATARVLAAAGYDVAAPPQGCCGALSAHAGRAVEADRFTTRLRSSFVDLDSIVVNSSGCGSHLKDRGLAAIDVTEALAGVTFAQLHPLALKVAYQDSCHLRHGQQLPAAWRPLLEAIPGLQVVEPAEQDLCCGSAGIYNITQPHNARRLGDRKAQHVLATGADALASANPGCLVQIAQALGRAGNTLPALHPVELLDASLRGVAAADLLVQARR